MGSLRVEGSDYLARPTKQRGGDKKEEEERGVVEGEGWGEEEVLAQGGRRQDPHALAARCHGTTQGWGARPVKPMEEGPMGPA